MKPENSTSLPLSEADTRSKLIDPAIYRRGWTEDHIRREETPGKILHISNNPQRGEKRYIDYVLRIPTQNGNQPLPVAVLEAKKNKLPPGAGLNQGKEYGKLLNVPFVFSSNGYQFVEYDNFTGITTEPGDMELFPSPEDLLRRYEKGMGFTSAEHYAKPLFTPYLRGDKSARYYQDAAIRAVLEKIAKCEKRMQPARILLSLATGTGKTVIAVNLLKRIADAGQLKRALFVCDRTELRQQAHTAFGNIFGSEAAEVLRGHDGSNLARNSRVHIATYQTLNVDSEDGDANFLRQHYPENHFSHIVIDECHRSAWGKWSEVLTRNPKAAHIGLTATPRNFETSKDTEETRRDKEITANNRRYFGEPIYEYKISQGMEDGYLAACEIQKRNIDLDTKGILAEELMTYNPKDAITGQNLPRERLKEHYGKYDFEKSIELPDRVNAMCKDLFDCLAASGNPEQKTVIFCASDAHAEAVVNTMNNLYAEWCRNKGYPRREPYAFKCTASVNGTEQLPDFRGSSVHHFIATTVDLLSTGVDVPCIRNIVFFRYIRSPIAFYQMLGRGTRIDFITGKLMFTVYDYTDATDFLGKDFPKAAERTAAKIELDEKTNEIRRIAHAEGLEVRVNLAGHYIIVQENGVEKRVPLEEYKQRMALHIMAEIPTPEELRNSWVVPEKRQELMDKLEYRGYYPEAIRIADGMDTYDMYDVLAETAFGIAPRSRRERMNAFSYKNEGWLGNLKESAAGVIRAIAVQFGSGGIEGLENPSIFKLDEVRKAGGIEALRKQGDPSELLKETKERMFRV